MKPWLYYNEYDEKMAAWIRGNIKLGLIPDGYVDERSIVDVQPEDLDGFAQWHFFAGLGTWAYAARLAGWPDARPLLTGSPPCQPYSEAGKRAGFNDPRDLWPHLFRLIRARRPACLVGEQVAAAIGHGWVERALTDLASENYAARFVDIPALAVDAPHIRNRLWFASVRSVALGDSNASWKLERIRWPEGMLTTSGGWPLHSDGRGEPVGQAHSEGFGGRTGLRQAGEVEDGHIITNGDGLVGLADSNGGRCAGRPENQIGETEQRASVERPDDKRDKPVTLGDSFGTGLEGQRWHGDQSDESGRDKSQQDRPIATPNGSFWSGADILHCYDGKARRSKPGIALLVNGATNRVPKWSGLGNGIVAPLAAEILKALQEATPAWSDQ